MGNPGIRCDKALAQGRLAVNETFPDGSGNRSSRFNQPRRMANHMKLTLVVACALVDADKRVLIAQRPQGKTLAGLWEFPGGKIEPG